MEETIQKRKLKLATFKKLFEELLQDLEVIKPGDPSLLLVKTAVSFLDAETVCYQFMDYAGPFKDRIIKKDETFFLEELDNSLDLEILHENSFVKEEIDRIRGIWKDKSTTKEHKTIIWNYLILLVKIGSKI
jgi:hypothetical protein